MTDAAAVRLRQEVKVVGVVSGGHFMSHCYSMMLPPLFPVLHMELGVSYTALGLMLSLRSLVFGSMQLPAGILVDRFGARLVLVCGFAIMLSCFSLMAMSHAYWVMAALFMLSGLGDAAIHPADYAIMNGTVSASRMGRSFSAHIFGGSMGMAVAPAAVLFMVGGLGWSWREVMFAFVLIGAVVVAGLLTQWRHIREDGSRVSKARTGAPAFESDGRETVWQSLKAVLTSMPMLFLLLFFSFSSLGTGAFKNFAVAGLVSLHGTSLEAAGGALTGFLAATAFGALAGGFVADRFGRHATAATIALLVSAAIAVLVGAVNLHYVVLTFVFTLAGLLQGIIRPARDMMIRAASPKGSIGKAFGFVTSGQAVGGTVAPVVFGAIIDIGAPQWLFYASALFLIVCMLSVLGSAQGMRRQRQGF